MRARFKSSQPILNRRRSKTGVPVTAATEQPTKVAQQPTQGKGFSLSLVLLPCLGGLLTLAAALWVFKSK